MTLLLSHPAPSSPRCLPVAHLTQLLRTAAHPWAELSGKVKGAGDAWTDLRRLLWGAHGEMKRVSIWRRGGGGDGISSEPPEAAGRGWRRLVLEFDAISRHFLTRRRDPEATPLSSCAGYSNPRETLCCRRCCWCVAFAELMVWCTWLTSRIASEARPPTPSSALPSPLCKDYAGEGVPHLHASHGGGGGWSFLAFFQMSWICFVCWMAAFPLLVNTLHMQFLLCCWKCVSDALITLQGHAELLQPRGGAAVVSPPAFCCLSAAVLLLERRGVQQQQQQQRLIIVWLLYCRWWQFHLHPSTALIFISSAVSFLHDHELQLLQLRPPYFWNTAALVLYHTKAWMWMLTFVSSYIWVWSSVRRWERGRGICRLRFPSGHSDSNTASQHWHESHEPTCFLFIFLFIQWWLVTSYLGMCLLSPWAGKARSIMIHFIWFIQVLPKPHVPAVKCLIAFVCMCFTHYSTQFSS